MVITARQQSCGKVMFSIMCVYLSVHGGIPEQGPGPLYMVLAIPPAMFKLVHYEARTVGEQAIAI